MNRENHKHDAADDDREHESTADRASKVPKRPQDTDASGNALNDTGQDNHHRKHPQQKP
jgi:hypothetical protein